MKYCVNCRKAYERPSSFCDGCFSDQGVPDEVIDAALNQYGNMGGAFANAPRFGFPGEGTALVTSLALTGAVILILGTLSVGIFLILVAFAVVSLIANQAANRRNFVPLGPGAFPKLHRIARLAAFRLKMPMPEVFIQQSGDYNAFTQGFGNRGFVVLFSPLVQDFSPAEVMFIIGHEFGHMKRYHTTWLSLMSPSRSSIDKPLLSQAVQTVFNLWSVKAEYTADQAGLLVVRDLDTAIWALFKVAAGADVKREINHDFLMSRTRSDTDLSSSLLEYFSDHPFLENRIKQLRAFSESTAYRSQAHDGWARGPR